MKKLIYLTAAITIVFLFNSCKKYPDGGMIGKAEKNIIGTWKLDSYYFNGIDSTTALLISNLQETYGESGSLVRTFTDDNGDFQSQSGSYKFDAEKSVIDVDGVGSIQLTSSTSTASTSTYTLLKLNKKELWYQFENGGDTHEFRYLQ